MLTAHSLVRSYGDRRVVDDVSFEVRPGRMTGFVGANGAGKTTIMRMLMGVLAPTEGEVRWDGVPASPAVRRSFGYMPEERGLFPRQAIGAQLIYLARLHGLSSAAAKARVEALLGHFELSDRLGENLDDLSLGNQQRVQVAAALAHRPTALVLDEPFSGLDPLAVDSMIDLLRGEAADLPVLFSSHQLDLVERLCDDLIVLSGGKIVAQGSVEELRDRGTDRYRVVLRDDAAWLRDVRGVEVHDVEGSSALVSLADLPPAELARLAVDRTDLIELSVVRQPLSEIFREVAA